MLDETVADAIKVAVCEYLLAVNRDFMTPPGTSPLIPPTAIDWLGDGLTNAVMEAVHIDGDRA